MILANVIQLITFSLISAAVTASFAAVLHACVIKRLGFLFFPLIQLDAL